MSSLVWKVYGFSIVMSLVAIVPYLNLFYSGHGGIAWFVLPFTFPYALIRMAIGFKKDNRLYSRFIKFSVPLYIVFALFISILASYSIETSLGLSVNYLDFYMLMLMPFSLPFFF